MKIFSTLKNQATDFLEQYKQGNPATYAAAEQAIGAVLITDGLIGIDNPLGENKRPGIFGTFIGIFVGILFMFIPTIVGNLSNVNNMTATTSATVVSVGSNTNSSACPMTVKYTVGGKNYTKQSGMAASNYCPLSEGQEITINYDPANPGSWVYGAKSFNGFLYIFFWVGIVALVSSLITFVIRLLSIILGWQLLRNGRKDAGNLPPGTNLETIISEIKQNFTKTVFNFGGNPVQIAPIAPSPAAANPQDNQNNPQQG